MSFLILTSSINMDDQSETMHAHPPSPAPLAYLGRLGGDRLRIGGGDHLESRDGLGGGHSLGSYQRQHGRGLLFFGAEADTGAEILGLLRAQ